MARPLPQTSHNHSFRREVLAGLREFPKRIPSKFFYDTRGSELFEQITEVPEYYLTRTERSILDAYLPEMAELIGPEATVVEFGTGAGIKTRMLLKALKNPKAYIPIDISTEQLRRAASDLKQQFPLLAILPVSGDYTNPISLPPEANIGHRVVFFPGSTIGNFTPNEAIEFLTKAARLVGDDGGILIGYDRVKNPDILEAAYNDSSGITAAFNLNLIRRIRNEFDAALSEEDFEHYAFFNAQESRVEMHLVSKRNLNICFGSEEVHFEEGEHIITEFSYKYTPEAFEKILSESGFAIQKNWNDSEQFFEVCFAIVPSYK
ncbi:MAG TPA: L-histidine N(alpha)-methyltransferase [Candidatus Kapabacteria bacterium]